MNRSRSRAGVGYAVEFIASLLLGLSAIAKSLQVFYDPLAVDLLWNSPRLTFSFIVGEWLLAWLGIFQIAHKSTHRTLTTLYACFVIYTLDRLRTGNGTCGCFGAVGVSPSLTIALDSSILAALVFWSRGRAVVSLSLPVATVLVFSVVLWPTLILAYRFEKSVTNRVFAVAELSKVGTRPRYLEKIFADRDLKNGSWIVVFYRRDCAHCIKAIPRFEQMARDSQQDSSRPAVALVEVPPFPESVNPLKYDKRWIHTGVLDPSYLWKARTPFQVGLRDGIVVSLNESTDTHGVHAAQSSTGDRD